MNDPAATSCATTPRWRDVEWWWLAFLGMLVFQPVFDPMTGAGDWVLAGAVVATYVPVYAIGYVGGERALVPVIVVTMALGVVTTPFNGGGSVLFVFAAGFAGLLDPPARARRWLWAATALLVVLAATSTVPFRYAVMFFAPSLVLVWVVGRANMAEAARGRESARLRVDNARIEHLATVGERERIARDLHDLLGHTLTAVVVRAQLVQRLATADPERAAEEAGGIEHAAREALAAVRETVSGYRAASLATEVEQARAALSAVGVDLDVGGTEVDVAPSVETALALSLREAVTNVVRHAEATTCTIRVVRTGDELRLEVTDDGRGGGPEGNGLRGMRERISALGGRVDRATNPGTTVIVAVPAQVAG